MKLLTAAEYEAETSLLTASTHVMVDDDGEWLADVAQSDDTHWTILAAKDYGSFVSFQCPVETVREILERKFPGR